LKRKLGRGESTEVWLARDVKSEREVALKFFPHHFLANVTTVERLDQEIRRSAQLAHPAIARVYDLLCDPQLAAIVTEFVEGWSLATVKVDQPNQRFRIEDINLWVHQLCVALDYAHHGFCLVHRSLKPSNILLNRREQLKVTDFGIDEAIRVAAPSSGQATLAGTIAYVSPQQLDGADPSVLDDIYSLGATIYDLLTGTPPFSKGNLRTQIRERAAPTMSERLRELEIDDSVPAAWEQVVAACLAKDPGQRPQSANEVLRDLETASNTRLVNGLEQPGWQHRFNNARLKALNFLRWLQSKIRGFGSRRIFGPARSMGTRFQKAITALRKNSMLLI